MVMFPLNLIFLRLSNFEKNRRHYTDVQRDGVQHLIRPARESHSMSCSKQAELQHKPNNIQRTLSLSCVMKLDNACMLLTATQLWRFQWLTSRRNIEWSHLVESGFCVLATFFTLSVLKLAIQPLRGALLQSAHSEVFKMKFNSKKYWNCWRGNWKTYRKDMNIFV